MKNKKVLIACEESQAVTIEMRKIGLEAYSCDIQPCSGGHPEWHLQQDVIPLLQEDWGLIIAHPPCTHLAISGAKWFKEKKKDGRQQQGIDFFMQFADIKCPRVAIENPVCIMSTVWRKPDQIIEPWHYGHSVTKKTCLWLKDLPKLKPTKIVDKGEIRRYKNNITFHVWYSGKDGKAKSVTFPGIAKAMADQWGRLLLQ